MTGKTDWILWSVGKTKLSWNFSSVVKIENKGKEL